MDWTLLRREILGAESQFQTSQSVEIPVLSHVVMEFVRKASDPQNGPRELGKIVETDAALTAELLRLVNSASYGLANKASTAQRAISLLGTRASKFHLLATGVLKSIGKGKWKLLELRHFWTMNLVRAMFAREVAKLIGADEDLAFAGGMIQDFMLPSLTTSFIDQYTSFSQFNGEQSVRLMEWEREQFNWDHAQVSARVLVNWGVPDDLVCCVLFHHAGVNILNDSNLGKTAPAAVALAGLLPDSFTQEPSGMATLNELDDHWPQFKLAAIAERVQEEVHDLLSETISTFEPVRLCSQ